MEGYGKDCAFRAFFALSDPLPMTEPATQTNERDATRPAKRAVIPTNNVHGHRIKFLWPLVGRVKRARKGSLDIPRSQKRTVFGELSACALTPDEDDEQRPCAILIGGPDQGKLR